MSEFVIHAKPRQARGRRLSSRMRAGGRLPASLYGRGEEPLSLEVDATETSLLYRRTLGQNALMTMKLEGQDDRTVMFKELQREPVMGKLLHVDFYHVQAAYPLKLRVPVRLTGTSKGVQEQNGVLDHPTRSVLVRCLPKDIPAEIKADVSHLGLHESLRLESVTPPPGVTFLSARHTVLAHVSEIEEEKAPEAAPGAESAAGAPEVITAKKEGEAAAAEPAAQAKGAATPAAKPAEKGKK